MKLSIKGYKDNSPDKGEKSLFINSNTLTMEGVSRPIVAIPIIKGKPDYTQKVVLKPGDADYTNPQATGFVEIPYAQAGLQYGNFLVNTPQMNSGIQTDNFGMVSYQQPNDFNNLTNLAEKYGQLDVNPRTAQDYSNYLNNTIPTKHSQEFAKSIPVQMEAPKNLTQEIAPKNDSFDKLQNMVGLLGQNTGVDTTSSLQNFGWSMGFNPDNYSHLSDNAKKTMKGANNVLKVASLGNALFKGAFDMYNGYATGMREAQDKESMTNKVINQYKNQHTFNMQKGGKVLTEGYTTGLPQGSPLQANVEVEAKEFIKDPNTGQVQEVLGDRHSEGGEMMQLEEGTKVISDYIEIGSKFMRELKSDFDLKNLTPKTTFATVLRRFRDKIGLTKKYEELETIINKIKDQEEIENQNTKDLNLDYLSKEYRTKLDEVEPLETQLKRFTDFIFESQEYKKAVDKDKERFGEMKKGGIIKTMQEGGQITEDQMMQVIDAFADLSNANPEEILQELQQMSPEEQQEAIQMMVEAVQQGGAEMQQQEGQMVEEQPTMQDGGEMSQEEQIIQAFAQATKTNPEEIYQQLQQASPEEQQQMLQQMMQFLQEQQGEQMQEEEVMMQEGGEIAEEQIMQIIEAFAQATNQDPNQIMQELQQMSPEEQQQTLIQMAQSLQGQEQNVEEEQMMQSGGRPKVDMSLKGNLKAIKDSYSEFIDDTNPNVIKTLIKLADPTGAMSYGDVKRAWSDGEFTYEDIVEPIGALPLIGKVGKVPKVTSGVIDLTRAWGKSKKLHKRVNNIDEITKNIDVIALPVVDKFIQKHTGKVLEKVIKPQTIRSAGDVNNTTRIINSLNRGATLNDFKFQEGGQIGEEQFLQVIEAYAQATNQDPKSLAQSLQGLSEEELMQMAQQMAIELQNKN